MMRIYTIYESKATFIVLLVTINWSGRKREFQPSLSQLVPLEAGESDPDFRLRDDTGG